MEVEIFEKKYLCTKREFQYETNHDCVFENVDYYDTTYCIKNKDGDIIVKSKKYDTLENLAKIMKVVESIKNNDPTRYICRECGYICTFWQEWQIEEL